MIIHPIQIYLNINPHGSIIPFYIRIGNATRNNVKDTYQPGPG